MRRFIPIWPWLFWMRYWPITFFRVACSAKQNNAYTRTLWSICCLSYRPELHPLTMSHHIQSEVYLCGSSGSRERERAFVLITRAPNEHQTSPAFISKCPLASHHVRGSCLYGFICIMHFILSLWVCNALSEKGYTEVYLHVALSLDIHRENIWSNIYNPDIHTVKSTHDINPYLLYDRSFLEIFPSLWW